MKKITALFFFFSVAASLFAQALSWDIKFLQGRARESVAISRAVRMDNGEDFLITITPSLDCFCYVVLYDAERKIFVLHDSPLIGGAEILFGPFEIVSPAGTETLYVIMSNERQPELEGLIQSFNNSPSRQNANNLYRKVVSLQTAASGLGEPASTFIASGGTNRGSKEEYATRFSGKDLYVRAITIRH
jgi:hypothetical protein